MWLRLKNTCKPFKFSLTQFCRLCSRFETMHQESLPWTICRVAIFQKEPKPRTLHCNNSWSVEEEHGTFRFCGKEFRQERTLTFMSQRRIERVQPINDDAEHGLSRNATANEMYQLRSVTQSLAWIARQIRAYFSFRISKIQSTFENARVRDLCECNRIVEYAISTSTRDIYFHQSSPGMMQSL